MEPASWFAKLASLAKFPQGRAWLRGIPPVPGYLAAALLAAAAQSAQTLSHPAASIRFIPYVPFIAVSVVIGGLGPGLFTTVLCTIECLYFATEPFRSFSMADPWNALGLGVLFFSGVLVIGLFELMRYAARSLAAANRELAAIYEDASVILLVVDERLRVCKANNAAGRFASREADGFESLHPGSAIRCLNSLADPKGCGFGPACSECRFRLNILDSLRNGTRHDNEEVWVPVSADPRRRCLMVSTAPLHLDKVRRVLVCAADITDRKLAEKELERQRDQLQGQAALIDLSRDAIIVMDANRVIRTWNRGAAAMYGWTRQEAVGRVTHELLHTKADVSLSGLDSILYREGIWEGELIQAHRDGHRIVTESRHVLMRDERGAPGAILEINRDITERKRDQDELREAHRRTSVILASISDGFVTLDRDWRYTYVNAAAVKMLSRTPAELLGKTIWEMWPLQASLPGATWYRKAMLENVAVRFEGYYPAPLDVWFDVRCYPSTEGLSIFFSDITERRRAEQAQQNSEQRLRVAQQIARIGTYEWDIETGVSRWTPEMERLHGLAPGEASRYYQDLLELLHPEDRPKVERLVEKSRVTGSGEGEWRVVWPDGAVHWLSGRWQAVPDESGKRGRMVGACIDITVSKLTETALRDTVRQLQVALKERTVLLKEVHHRVKNNLAVISSLLAMQAEATGNADARRVLEESQQRVQSIALIHEHLYGTEHLDRVDFAEYARELIDGLYGTFRHSELISVALDAKPVRMGVHRAVPCALILNELLSNAFKYAFPNGRAGRVLVICGEIAPNRVKLVVEDDGVGIPEGLDWRNAPSLGFQIVQILASQIGATIELVRGRGTRFEITLPRQHETPPEEAHRRPPEEAGAGR